MKNIVLIVASLIAAWAHAKEPVYVGGGRYACSDKSARCAEIQQRNDLIEMQERERREREQEQERRQRKRERERDHEIRER